MKKTITCLWLMYMAANLPAASSLGISAGTNGGFLIRAPGVSGNVFTFESSSNLLDWQVGAVRASVPGGSATLEGAAGGAGFARFYRVHEAGSLTGLVSWWHADGNGSDSVGTNHARLTNGVSFVPGQFGQGFGFGGTNGWLEIGGQALPPPWTFACWVKRAATLDNSAALLGDTNTALKLEQYPFTHQVGFTRFGVGDFLFNYTAPTNEWVHLTFVSETNRTLLYAAGLPVGTNAATIALPLGYFGGATKDRLNGVVDEAVVFGRALAPDEVYMLHSLPRVPASRLPQVRALSGTNGPATGGTTLNIHGTNFLGATRVLFAHRPANFSIVNDGQIQVVTPADYAGVKTVRVESAHGVSAATTNGVFKYDYVVGMFPSGYPLSINGNSDAQIKVIVEGLPPGASASFVWSCAGVDNSQGDMDCEAAMPSYIGTTDHDTFAIHCGPFTFVWIDCRLTLPDGTQMLLTTSVVSDDGGGQAIGLSPRQKIFTPRFNVGPGNRQ
jgi:hypothetical protein